MISEKFLDDRYNKLYVIEYFSILNPSLQRFVNKPSCNVIMDSSNDIVLIDEEYIYLTLIVTEESYNKYNYNKMSYTVGKISEFLKWLRQKRIDNII